MPVYNITHTLERGQICLFLDSGCQLSCHGCIVDVYPMDYHLSGHPETLEKPILDVGF